MEVTVGTYLHIGRKAGAEGRLDPFDLNEAAIGDLNQLRPPAQTPIHSSISNDVVMVLPLSATELGSFSTTTTHSKTITDQVFEDFCVANPQDDKVCQQLKGLLPLELGRADLLTFYDNGLLTYEHLASGIIPITKKMLYLLYVSQKNEPQSLASAEAQLQHQYDQMAIRNRDSSRF